MYLKTVSTDDLIKELEARPSIEKISVGPEDIYTYRRKFEPRRRRLEPGTVLLAVINKTPDSSSMQE